MRPKALAGTLSARLALRIVEFCRARGHDPAALCSSVGLTVAALAAPEARVHYEVVARLGARAIEVTGDENFGLHLAADVGDTRAFDTGVLLLMASPTIRVALERMVTYQRTWGDGQRTTLRQLRSGLAVRYVLPGATGAYARHADECAMAELAFGVRALSGQALLPREVRFRHAPPPSSQEHRALLGCPVHFASPHTEILFGDDVLETRMPHANETFATIFAQQVEAALARLPNPTSTSEGVRLAARAALAAGGCTLAGTARALGLGTRTLQRRLHTEGTSFGAVSEALRREMSLAYLERRVPVAEVAALLGYADATAFHHAFRRWTGSSPSRHPGHRGSGGDEAD